MPTTSPGDAPTVYLAHGGGRLPELGHDVNADLLPALLVSSPFVATFMQTRRDYRCRHWCMDSGAFSAWNSGVEVTVAGYTALARDTLAADPTLREVFALDVINDWRTTTANTEAMWAAGVPAIPTYHVGEPWDVLAGYARDYPKVAVGGMAQVRGGDKRRFAEQVFARVWPTPLHGFAIGSHTLMQEMPWHSVDAATWSVAPQKFGRWTAYSRSGAQVPLHGRGAIDKTVEVRRYLDSERRMRWRWRREMATLAERLAGSAWDRRAV